MMIDAASERSEQGRFLSKRPGSSNAVLGRPGENLAFRMADPIQSSR
jgi:hypothetical protein